MQDAQELGLHLERDLADLVQKERAPVRQLEAANALAHGPCKGPTLVPEEFAFEQARGNGGAVQLHEGVLMPGAEVVNGARQEFLARARFAGEEHRRVGWRHDLHLVQHVA